MVNIIPGPPTLRDGSIRPDAKDTTLEFYWEEPLFQMPPAEVSSYTLSCSSISFSQSVTSSTLYIKVSSLANNIPYSFQITAENSNGVGNPNYFRTVQPGLVPNSVTNASANVLSNAIVQIDWEGPTSDVSIPSTGWFVVQSISSSPSDPEIRVSAYATASTAIISSLNIASRYAFNVYAVNDPGYSLPISTNTVVLADLVGDTYTYYTVITVAGSANYNYRIYNSQLGWGGLINTGINSIQYRYDYGNGGGPGYFCKGFGSDDYDVVVSFMSTSGTALQTFMYNDYYGGFSLYPNSFNQNIFFNTSLNGETGLYHLQLYQANTGLYQSTSQSYLNINAVPLQNSVVFWTGSESNTVLHYIWPVTESNPIFLYESYGSLESPLNPVNNYTGVFNVAAINNTDYLDTVNNIIEPSTYTTYMLPESTYTNFYNYDTESFGPKGYGNNNGNNFVITLYNSNTTFYDIYIWNNFSNSSNFSNPIILSNIGMNSNYFELEFYYRTVYRATYATNAIIAYDFNVNLDNYTGIGTTYSIFENGSTYSTVFTSTNVALLIYPTCIINSNATGVLQLDAENNISLVLCSQTFGQSTILISSATEYRTPIADYAEFTGYTNFISIHLPLADEVNSHFITIQTDTGDITTFSTTTYIDDQYYCGSTGIIQYSNNLCDVLFNGVITSTIPTEYIEYSEQPDLALGTVYGYSYTGNEFSLYTAHPTGVITSTLTIFSTPFLGFTKVTPSAFFAYTYYPFSIMAQTLDDTQSFYSASGNTFVDITDITQQFDSVCFPVQDNNDEFTRIYVIYNYASHTFSEFRDTVILRNTRVYSTSPYTMGT